MVWRDAPGMYSEVIIYEVGASKSSGGRLVVAV